jgi:hypothetical protein
MAADSKKSAKAASAPTEETYWKRYSPHHECLLSWVGSATVHGLVFGIMFLSGLMVVWARSSEVRRPPSMDVVQLSPGAGEEGGGGDPAPLGQDPVEAVNNVKVNQKQIPETQQDKIPDIKTTQLDVPVVSPLDPGETQLDDKTLQGLEQAFKAEPPKQKVAVGSPKGDPKGTGPGGLGGDGVGPGKGRKAGPGVGLGGAAARTKQQIFAQRWRFYLSEKDRTGKEHAEKLEAMGIILAVPDGAGRVLLVRDFKRRPVETRLLNAAQFQAQFKDAVHWYNKDRESVSILAEELRLPFIPPLPVIMLLPKERELKMAEVEQRFAERRGRSVNTIRETHFDFQLRNGAYEPVVIRQE